MKEVITIDKRRGSLEENRKHNLDFLTTISGIAILCVVLIHVHQRYLPVIFGEQIPVYSRLPVIDQLLEHLVMFAVGIFVLIAGFKFELTRTISSFEEYTDFVKKRINRLIRPYFWLTTIFAVGGAILQILNLAPKKEMG